MKRFLIIACLTITGNCATGNRFKVRNEPINTGEFAVTIVDHHFIVNEGSLRTPYVGCDVKNITNNPLRLLSMEACADSVCTSNAQRSDILLPEQSVSINACLEVPYKNAGGNKVTIRVLSEPINGRISRGSGIGDSKRERREYE